MNLEDTIVGLQERVSEECFNDILNITEEFIHERRRSVLNSISKAFTGKAIEQHAIDGAKKLFNTVKDKVSKTEPVRNTIGKSQLDKAQKELDMAELDYDYSKDMQRRFRKDDPSRSRVYGQQAKIYNKEADKKAKRVAEIKRQYGFD